MDFILDERSAMKKLNNILTKDKELDQKVVRKVR